jgi:hypothetical protein
MIRPFNCFFVIIIITILGYGGCKNRDDLIGPDNLPPSLNGQVKDSQGNPVEGCGVHYIFSMTSSPLAKIDKTCPSTVIQFSVPGRSKVTLRILRWFTRDIIATLVDDTLNSGSHVVTFDATTVTNGIYLYQLTIDTTLLEESMVLLNTDISALAKTVPLVTTDARGNFSLPYGLFGFGIPFQRTSASGPTLDTVYVSHTIQIVLSKSGYATSVTTITIDKPEGISQTFTLARL